MYSKQAEQELLQIVREFHTGKQEEGQSVSSHGLKMKGYIDNLERVGQPVGQNLAVSLILVSLNKDFDSFVQNYNMHGMGKIVNELHAMLKLHEETLPKKDANPALYAIRAGKVQKNQKNKPHKVAKGGHGKGKGKMSYASNNAPFAPKPKTPPPPKKDNPAKDAICHQCGKVGHRRRNCPVYLAELMKKKKLSQGASTLGIFTIELYSFPSKSWIYDTGCGIHICITTQGLWGSKKLKPVALSLYVGDGHRAAVKMTTSVGNNLVFRSFFEKQKLTEPNFIDWYNQLHLVLSTEDKENYLEHHIPAAPVAPPGQQVPPQVLAAHAAWVKELKAMYSKQAKQELLQTVREFHTRKQEEGQSNYNMHGMGKTINELHVMLKLHEETLPKKDANLALHAIRAGRTPSPPKKDNPAKDAICYQCGEVGHWRRNYPVYLAELMKKKKPSQGASTLGSTGNPSENKVFVARNAKFFESKLLDLKASGSVEDLKLIQEEDINPSVDTSLNHEEDD
nr:zinc finger, CCHC-type [Tanacetum cinerariifolium]